MDAFRFGARGGLPLCYCTNVHPWTDLRGFEEVCRERVRPALAEALGLGGDRSTLLCLGAWWPGPLVEALCEPEERARHAAVLRDLGLVPSSLNLFPIGVFHGRRVKEDVYTPDWAEDARLRHTLEAASVQAEILRGFGIDRGAISSLPLGFRGRDRCRRPAEAHAENLLRAALGLARLEEEFGVRLVLGLEPEPWCLCETVAELLTWLQDVGAAHAASAGAERRFRRHVGVCLDLCHAFVAGEDAVEAYRLCRCSGFPVPKVQCSAARIAEGPAGIRALRACHEPVWLHQCWVEGRDAGPFLDLDDPGLKELEARADSEVSVRCHFHAPLQEQGDGPLRTSRDALDAFLRAVRHGLLEEGTILEVETYTDPDMRPQLRRVVEILGFRVRGSS